MRRPAQICFGPWSVNGKVDRIVKSLIPHTAVYKASAMERNVQSYGKINSSELIF